MPINKSPSRRVLSPEKERPSTPSSVDSPNPFFALPGVVVGALGDVVTKVGEGGKAMADGAQSAVAYGYSELGFCTNCACVVNRRSRRVTTAAFTCAACSKHIESAADVFMALDQATCSSACQLAVAGDGKAAGGWQVRLPAAH